MHIQHKKYLLVNRIFISGLLILILNDHFLKYSLHNAVTGKLSDVAGLLILPLFLQYLFDAPRGLTSILAGAVFVYWKLPISQNVIDLYNRITPFGITRSVDYSDLFALCVLPFSEYVMRHPEKFSLQIKKLFFLHPGFLLVISAIAFMATSPPISFYMQPGGDVHIGKSYKLKISKQEALKKLSEAGFLIVPDTAMSRISRAEYFRIENLVLKGGKDLIEYIEFGFHGNDAKPVLLLNNVKLKNPKLISDWRELKYLSKYYRKLIQNRVLEEVKE